MRFQTELVPARLVRRYKRFLADCTLEGSDTQITAHCANPGSMMGLSDEGTRIWLEPNDDSKKKLDYGWRLIDHQNGHFTGVDTGAANRVVKEALLAGQIAAFADYTTVQPEVRYGDNSRIDFLLGGPDLPDVYLEVKSVTLSRKDGLAEFPDSVTARGTKHLRELARMIAQGHRAVLLYLVQRTDCTRVAAAADIDPIYAQTLDAARAAGLEVIALGTRISPHGIDAAEPLTVM